MPAGAQNVVDPRLQDYLAMCQAVGHVVIYWSVIEQQLDQWVSLAHQQFARKGSHKRRDLPVSFDRKREFLRDCFSNVPELESFKMEAKALLGRAANLAQQRHDLVHGALIDFAPSDRIFRFRMLKARKDHHEQKIISFNPAYFPKLERSLAGLATDLIEFSERLTKTFSTQTR